MTENSFQFGKYNSLDDLGIYCEYHDTLIPPKNSRKIQIPGISGMHDFGSETYGERTLELECKLIDSISKAQLREIAYKLSGKEKLIFWDEPDKHYIAELFDPTEIINMGDRLWLEFVLTFVCEPFAYKELSTFPVNAGQNDVEYNGTVKTPTLITLRNNNDFEISNVIVTLVRKKG